MNMRKLGLIINIFLYCTTTVDSAQSRQHPCNIYCSWVRKTARWEANGVHPDQTSHFVACRSFNNIMIYSGIQPRAWGK